MIRILQGPYLIIVIWTVLFNVHIKDTVKNNNIYMTEVRRINVDGKHATGAFLSAKPVHRDGKIEKIDYLKLSDLPVSDFELMGYAIGILINRMNAFIDIHNEKIEDDKSLL